MKKIEERNEIDEQIHHGILVFGSPESKRNVDLSQIGEGLSNAGSAYHGHGGPTTARHSSRLTNGPVPLL